MSVGSWRPNALVDQRRIERVAAEAIESVLTSSERKGQAGAGDYRSAIRHKGGDGGIGFNDLLGKVGVVLSPFCSDRENDVTRLRDEGLRLRTTNCRLVPIPADAVSDVKVSATAILSVRTVASTPVAPFSMAKTAEPSETAPVWSWLTQYDRTGVCTPKRLTKFG